MSALSPQSISHTITADVQILTFRTIRKSNATALCRRILVVLRIFSLLLPKTLFRCAI